MPITPWPIVLLSSIASTDCLTACHILPLAPTTSHCLSSRLPIPDTVWHNLQQPATSCRYLHCFSLPYTAFHCLSLPLKACQHTTAFICHGPPRTVIVPNQWLLIDVGLSECFVFLSLLLASLLLDCWHAPACLASLTRPYLPCLFQLLLPSSHSPYLPISPSIDHCMPTPTIASSTNNRLQNHLNLSTN